MSQRVFRVILNGKGLDLIGAFQKASGADWAELVGATGRNPFAVSEALDELYSIRAMSPADRATALKGEMGMRLLDTVADLVFLARRREGVTEPGTGRPITYETSVADTPIIEALDAFVEAMRKSATAGNDAQEAPDPT